MKDGNEGGEMKAPQGRALTGVKPQPIQPQPPMQQQPPQQQPTNHMQWNNQSFQQMKQPGTSAK